MWPYKPISSYKRLKQKNKVKKAKIQILMTILILIGLHYTIEFLKTVDASEGIIVSENTDFIDYCELDSIQCEGEVIERVVASDDVKPVAPIDNRMLVEADIKALIEEKFGDDAEEALKIASCESRFNPEAIGDTNLTYQKDGKMYGDSIGIFQIRTFPNRPDREELKDPKFNIEYASDLFEKTGNWMPWYNCGKMVGAI